MAAPDGRGRALNVRLFMAMLQCQELLAGYLGVRLGLYEALAEAPATAPELADRAGIAPRYAREWLEQQAVAGFLDVDDAFADADTRRYTLPEEHAAVLLPSDDPLSMAALTMLPLGGVAAALPSLLEVYRTGEGVPDEVFGADWRNGHSGANRALFTHALPGWLPSVLPDLHSRLSAQPSRIADIGCGAGWAAIAFARSYPHAVIDGYDLDAETIAMATDNAKAAGVADRVAFHERDAAQPVHTDGYDLVCLFDALHEMAHPVSVLETCRSLRAETGVVLVMDARVATRFFAPGDEIERFQYATSVLHCLPAGLAPPESTAPGTVLRPDHVRRLAQAAGFTTTRELRIPDRFHRLYLLTP